MRCRRGNWTLRFSPGVQAYDFTFGVSPFLCVPAACPLGAPDIGTLTHWSEQLPRTGAPLGSHHVPATSPRSRKMQVRTVAVYFAQLSGLLPGSV